MPKTPSEWKVSITELLKEANLPSCRERVEWLCSRMDEHLGRFIGFAEQGLSIATLIRGDLFTVVHAAIEVIGDELGDLPPDKLTKQVWNDFKEAVSHLERTRDLHDVPAIRQEFDRFKTRIFSS
jgi:hypothetical protein